MSNIQISVIVPIFNSEKYLSRCINSLINQSVFQKSEIILINDGSIDSSYSICKEFARKYLNIHVFSQSNKGVSAARNQGLKVAKGEYITFFDSDDYADEFYLESMLKLIVCKNADVAINDFYRVFKNQETIKYRKKIITELETTPEILKSFFYGGVIGNNLCDKLFKADIALNCMFPDKYRVGEDMYYLYQVLAKSSKVAIDTSEAHYYYFVNELSAMNSDDMSRYYDTIELSKMMCDDLKNDYLLKNYATAHLAHEECKATEYIIRRTKNLEDIKALRNKIKTYPLFFLFKYLNARHFIGICLMRFSPSLYLFFHKKFHVG